MPGSPSPDGPRGSDARNRRARRVAAAPAEPTGRSAARPRREAAPASRVAAGRTRDRAPEPAGSPRSGTVPRRDTDSRGARPAVPAKAMQVVPVRRLLSLATGGFAILLAVGLIMGAQTSGVGLQRLPYAVVVLGTQLLYILATTMAIRPPGGAAVVIVGAGAAVASDVMVSLATEASITQLGLVAGGAVVAGVLAQIVRREGRLRFTESVGATLVIVIGVLALATLLLLVRIPVGTQAIAVCLAAAGVALSIARLTDVGFPYPRLAPQVPRGAVGVILGTMAGTAVAGFIGVLLVGFNPRSAAIAGALAATVGVLTDLTVGYAEAGRERVGDPPTMWLARHMQGPLAGFAMAAPVAYGLSIFFLSPA